MEKMQIKDSSEISGRVFRVPFIYGLGSGDGFDFAGLNLLEGWQKSIDELQQINPVGMNKALNTYLKEHNLPTGKISFDKKTKLVTEILIETSPQSRVFLTDDDFHDRGIGVYKAENVSSLKAAFVLQRFVAAGLYHMWKKLGFGEYGSCIDGGSSGYCSRNLSIPKDFWKTKEPITNQYFQGDFMLRASNICGRFGLTLERIQFNDSGILRSFDVKEGNSCGYFLEPDGYSREYHSHNVDSLQQAAALHGIGASFVNELWRRKLGGLYHLVDY